MKEIESSFKLKPGLAAAVLLTLKLGTLCYGAGLGTVRCLIASLPPLIRCQELVPHAVTADYYHTVLNGWGNTNPLQLGNH